MADIYLQLTVKSNSIEREKTWENDRQMILDNGIWKMH